jgi:predicted ArsR family transcriptional regulator
LRPRNEGKLMRPSGWGERFLATTRGRILALLRRSSRTVNELAEALGLTDNAVRAHLATLERDGLVQQTGSRPGFRKPNLTYDVTPAAGRFFPKPYGPLLQQLLVVLSERLAPPELAEALREVGRRVAALYRDDVQGEDLRERVIQAAGVLTELGGLAEVEEGEGKLLIRGFDCPLAAAVEGHPGVCCLAEAMLSELVGAPVAERCLRETPPRCVFEVLLPRAASRDGAPPGCGHTGNDSDVQ